MRALSAISRRRFLADTASTVVSSSLLGAALQSCFRGEAMASFKDLKSTSASGSAAEFDFVVIGSGAGGGVLAHRLIQEGFNVLIIEAGPKPTGPDVTVPGLNLRASADPLLNWNFFVQHYTDPKSHGRRYKAGHLGQPGILYPRASAIGGCTEHHVMLMLPPHVSEWERLAEELGDASWMPSQMRVHYEAVRTWLPIQYANPAVLRDDPTLTSIVASAGAKTAEFISASQSHLNIGNSGSISVTSPTVDPMDWEQMIRPKEGLCLIPQSIKDGQRFGVANLLAETDARFPGRLKILTGCLATRILTDKKGDGSVEAIGVEVVEQDHAYRASPVSPLLHSPDPKPTQVIRARKEIIISAGAYNTPQLLMLSGIGASAELKAHQIPVVLDRPGVGKNLQDRYELSVVRKFERAFALTQKCSFDGSETDPCMKDYLKNPQGSAYGTNGVLFGIKLKSSSDLKEPDLFVFGAPARFEGYEPGFAQKATQEPRYFTWAVLKAYSNNRSGSVSLSSSSPFDPPKIEFRYFNDRKNKTTDSEGAAHDLKAVETGVRYARSLASAMDSGSTIVGNPSHEVFPGSDVQASNQLQDFIAREAWGHHASCTAKIGKASDPLAVVDSQFRVHGAKKLRIVDASVFPRIPGFYIALPIYILAEKAAASLLREHQRS